MCSYLSFYTVKLYMWNIYLKKKKKEKYLLSGQNFLYFPPDVPLLSKMGYQNFHNQWHASSK